MFTDDDALAEVLRSLRVHGKGSDKYDTVRIGINSRLDTLQAAVLLAKLTVFDDEIVARQGVAAHYSERLQDIGFLRLPPTESSAWAQYTVQIHQPVSREALVVRLSARRIPTAVYYPRALHEQPAYARGPSVQECAAVTSAALASTVLSLPMHPHLSFDACDRVIGEIASSESKKAPRVVRQTRSESSFRM